MGRCVTDAAKCGFAHSTYVHLSMRVYFAYTGLYNTIGLGPKSGHLCAHNQKRKHITTGNRRFKDRFRQTDPITHCSRNHQIFVQLSARELLPCIYLGERNDGISPDNWRAVCAF